MMRGVLPNHFDARRCGGLGKTAVQCGQGEFLTQGKGEIGGVINAQVMIDRKFEQGPITGRFFKRTEPDVQFPQQGKEFPTI